MRLFKVLVFAVAWYGIVLPCDISQSTTFSSYVRGVALFCAGMACMKGTSYLYQRYNAYRHQNQLNDIRRLSIDKRGCSVKSGNDDVNLFDRIGDTNALLRTRLGHEYADEVSSRVFDETMEVNLLPFDVKLKLEPGKRKCVEQMEESYKAIYSHLNNIEYQYLVFTTTQSQRQTLTRSFSSIFGGSSALRKRVSRTWSNILTYKNSADHGQAEGKHPDEE